MSVQIISMNMIEAVTFMYELTRRIPSISDPRTRIVIEQKDGSGIGVAISIKIGDEAIDITDYDSW